MEEIIRRLKFDRQTAHDDAVARSREIAKELELLRLNAARATEDVLAAPYRAELDRSEYRHEDSLRDVRDGMARIERLVARLDMAVASKALSDSVLGLVSK